MFHPRERSPEGDIAQQTRRFADIAFFRKLMDAVSDIILILNRHRQVVMANQNLIDSFGLDAAAVYGLRPGELLNCVHAFRCADGCGGTEFCKTCGAANAIANSRNRSATDIQECRISRRENLGSLDLRVKATPVTVKGEDFTIFVITDVSHEKRRQSLERIFFHDILNLAGNVVSMADLMKHGLSSDHDHHVDLIYRSASMLISEITAQRDLSAAENDELAIDLYGMNSLELLQELADVYAFHKTAAAKQIVVDDRAAAADFLSDKTLLARVLGNMIKNALEASRAGDVVAIGCEKDGDFVRFWVHNSAPIPEDVQRHIFQRSFSTKSKDRGLGTYSMKLLTEKYLKGSISFTSDPERGAVFFVRIPVHRPDADAVLKDDAGVG